MCDSVDGKYDIIKKNGKQYILETFNKGLKMLVSQNLICVEPVNRIQ